ncbi:DUF2064 domain-containing protein [Tenacibaculum aiptasiae]|uniref:DUF2064 domain-containing protein n=1 Tax=Tenacibaculum aiptasiae TaxID=426481 RepID=UPI003B5A855A
MIHYQKQTAILLFAYSPEKEANHKVFEKSKKLFQQLNQKTFEKAQKTGTDVLVITEKQQIGSSFGERFANAIQTVFNKGYSQIITIGNDSPNLETSHLLKALHNLENGNATLGPSYDGGTYLIALNKEQFSLEAFKKITWNTHKVFSELKNYFVKRNTNITQLAYLADIDSKKDIYFFIDQFKNSFSILRELIELNANKVISFLENLYTSKSYSYSFFNKGSPITL